MKLITDSSALYCTSTPIQPAIDYAAPTTTSPIFTAESLNQNIEKKERKRKKGEETLRMMNRGDDKSEQVDVKH